MQAYPHSQSDPTSLPQRFTPPNGNTTYHVTAAALLPAFSVYLLQNQSFQEHHAISKPGQAFPS